MPIYEYRCDECDEKFELFVRSATQKAVPTCPKCGSNSVRKETPAAEGTKESAIRISS